MNDSFRPDRHPGVVPPREVPCTCPGASRHALPRARLRHARWFLAALLALPLLPGPAAFAQDRVEQVTGVSLTLGQQTGEVDVAWDRPGGDVTDYRILWRRADSNLNWRDQPDGGDAFPTARSYTISGLQSGQEYVVRVRGRNNGVGGPWSDHAYITLPEPPPAQDPPAPAEDTFPPAADPPAADPPAPDTPPADDTPAPGTKTPAVAAREDQEGPAATLEADSRTAAAGTVIVDEITLHLIVGFSEPVSGLTVDDFIVTNGQASDMVERPWGPESQVWDFFVTPEAEGEVTVQLPARAVEDADGNPNPASAIFRITAVGAPVAIAATSTAIVEGQAATFVLTRDASFRNPVTVEVAASGSFAAANQTVSVQLARFETSATFTMPSDDDDVPEADGPLTVSVVDGDTYDPGDPASARVTVADNDLPFVTMETDAESVNEAGSVTFTLTREGPLTESLTIPGTLLRSNTDPAVPPARTNVRREHEVTFAPGSATATLTIAPGDDDRFFVYRQLNVRLRTGAAGLFRLRVPASDAASDLSDATRTDYHLPVVENDPIRIAVAPRDEYVYEDEQACFTFSHNVVPHDFHFLDDPVAFTATFSQQGDFLAETPADRTVTVRADSPTHPLCLELADDETTEAAGSVTVAIVADAGANIVAEAGRGSATVRLLDNERPLVTLSANGADTVTEGGRAGFKLSLSAPTVVPFTVKYRLETDGDYGFEASDEGVWLYSFGPGAEEFVRQVSTRNDDVDEPDGSVTVTLLDEYEYDLDPDGPARIVLTVADDDVPAISMTAPDDPRIFDEGDEVTLTFTREGDLTPSLTIPAGHLESSYDADVTPGATSHGAITFEASSATATLTVTVENDDFYYPGLRNLRFTLRHDDSGLFRLAAGAQTHDSVEVRDDDQDAITIGIEAVEAAVTEADQACFVINLEKAWFPPGFGPGVGYDVELSVTQNGAWLAPGTETRHEEALYRAATPFCLDLEDDDRPEDAGSVTVAIVAFSKEGLAAADRPSATVAVADDDFVPTLVSLAAAASQLAEGAAAEFTLSRTIGSFGDGELPVDLRVTEVGDYLDRSGGLGAALDAAGNARVTFAAGAATAPFRLLTVDDDDAESEGSLTVELTAPGDDTDYTLHGTTSATTTVRSEDLIEVSVAAVSTPVTEGEDAVFRFTRTGSAEGRLSVAVQVRGHKKVMSPASRALAEKTGPGPDLTVVFEDGVTEVTQTLTTEADRYNEGDGEIVLLVEDLLGTTELPYRIRGSESGAVLVRDDDIPEVELRWITPTARLEDDTWVGEIVEGSDIDVEVTCTGGTLSPPGVGIGINPKLRIIVEHEERLNHPINTHHDRRRLGIRYPCDQDAEFSYRESGSRRWTGPANGLILLDLQPQRLSTNLSITECYSDMIPFGWKSGNIEFCPKYTLGTATKARVAVLNRNPTITVEAVSDEVTEGELARFRLTRIWNALNLSPVGGYTTTVAFTAAAEGDYVTDDLPAGPRTFGVAITEIIIEIPTVDDDQIAADGEVTLELLPQGAESSRVNVGASYEIYDRLEGITPPGKSSLRAVVRIRNNDDERSIDIDDAAAAEHAGAVGFPVTLSGPDHLRTVSASWKTAAGSATAGRDYTASGGTVEFPPGETEATIRVPVANDALDEPDEDFTVTLFDPENGVFPGSDTVSATGTIHDNDLPAVSIRTSDAIAAQHDRVEEGENIEFVLTRDGQTDKPLRASFTIQFIDRSVPVTGFFGVGESTVTVSVTAPEDEILNDPSDRPAVATVTGQDGVYAVGDPASKTVTIYDDDREKAIFLGGFQSTHFTGAGNTPENWFRYSVSNAGNGSTDGPVRVESEQFDTVACGDEALASGVANVYCSSPTYTVTQADVDAGEVTIRATATDGTTVSNELSFRMVYQPDQKLIFEKRYGVKEGDDALVLVVSLSAKIDEIVLMESDQTVQVDYQTTGPPSEDQVAATPASDYEAVSGTLTFTPGQTTQTVSVPILADELNEPKERFRVQFSNPRHAQLPRNSALVTIVDAPNPDNKPVVSIEPTREGPVYESAGFFDFDVVLSRTSGHVLTDVEIYMPGKGSAKPGRTAAEYESGDDYVALGARAVRFEPGQTRRTVSVPLYDDDVVEPDETFVIQLQLNETNRVSLHGTKSEATGTIVDDDASAIHLSVEPPAAVAEDGGARTMTVTAALDRGLPLPVAATVAVEVGGGGDAGRDFEAVAAFSVEIPAGEARGTATFELTPVADDVDEEDREVAVTGQVTAGPTNLPVTATSLTITDNDERGVTVTPTELTVNEGGTGAYTVVLTSAPTEPVTVAVETPSGTAVRVSPASLVFTADDWDDEQTVTVEAAADDDAAADEPVTLTHTVSGGDYGDDNVAADPVKVTIDEADMATLAIAAAGASEADGAVTFTVSLSAHGAEPVSVAYATADVTALAASDYTQTSGTLTFAADEFEKSIRVPLTDDALDEADAETFILTLSSATGAALPGGAAALTVSGTIEDDDARGIAVEPTHLDLAEGASGSYTVALASQPSADVTVALRVGGDADVTADASSLTFTAANWRQAQRVTVSAAADADAKDDVAAVVHTVSGGDYEANDVPAKPVVVEVDDDETPSTAVTLSVDPASLREDAGSTEVTVTAALDGGAPTEDTEVTVSVGSGTAIEGEDFAALADVTLTIGAGELSGAATFDLAPVNDDLDERPETVSVTGSAAGLSVTGAAVTITDDDVRGVTVSERSLDVAEGEERTYTVVLTSQPTGDVSVNLTVADDRPADRNDRSRASEPREDAAVAVTVQPEVLTFTAEDWRTPKTVTVRGAVDLDAEDDRARVVNRASGADYNRLPVGIVRVTVRDADAPALVAPASLTVMEGGSATYGVTLATRPTGPVTVTISGHAGTDLTVSPATLGFAVSNWNRKQDVRVTAAADADIADGEVTLGHAATGADYGGVSADVAVTVTDVTPTLSITEAAAAPEHAGNLVFEVQLSAPAGEDVTVGYATSDGTATAGEDYTAAAGDATLTIAAGERTARIAVPITNDSVDEVNETFTVTLRDPENAALARGRETATGTIADDDAATLSVADARVKEARGARVPFAVTLSAPSSRQVTVAYETAEGTAKAGEDYDAAEGTLTFAAGETGKTIEVFVRNDILDELDETFTLQLLEATNAALARGRETATGTIADNDDPPPLSVGGDNRVESAGSSTFRVGLGWPSSLEVTVNYATGPLQDAIQPSATEGVDYEGVQGTLTFAPGETRKDVPVTLIDDQLDEVDEHIGLLLSEARNATMTRSSRGNLLIYDNDDPNTKFSIAGARAGEDAGEMVFSVGLDNASGRDMTVEWETSDGTATEGRDYTAAEGTLTFAAGTTAAQEIRVAINDDTVDEAEEETFTVTLHNAEHANLFGGGTTLAATGTIVDDDDPVVTVAFDTDSHTATEDGDAATVRVRLSDDPERTVEIPLTRTPGTDVTDGDYSGVPESMIFASGETEKRFTVRATDDDVDEDDETVTLGFGTGLPDGVTPGSPGRATVTLRDNDTRGVTVSEKALEIDEGGTVSYTVKLNSEPTGEVRVAISGMADTDVSATPTSLTFPADDWDEEQTLTVSAAEDADALADAPVTLTHTVSGADYGDNNVTADPVAVTVVEKDAPTLSMSGVGADEDAGDMVFTVTLSTASSNEVTVAYATSNGTGAEAATAGSDYTQTQGTLTFPANSRTAQTIAVPINDDTVDEAEEETFTVTLSEAANAHLAGGGTTLARTGTIVDNDDPAVTVAFAAATYTATEGGSDATVQVRLSGDPERTVEIPLTHAPDDGDYSGVPESVTFNRGETEKTFTVRATDDAVDDDGETVTLGFGTGLPDGVTPGSRRTATVTLADNDARAVTVSRTELEIDEGATGSYTVKLNSEPTEDVTVTPSRSSGDEDVTVSEALTFTTSNWETPQTVTVEAAQDADAADDAATIANAVSGGDYGSVSAAVVRVTVDDNETESTTVTLSVSPQEVSESGGGQEVTVTGTLNGGTRGEATTVTVSVSPGSAASSDFGAVSDFPVTIPANQASGEATFTLTPEDDAIDEDDETVSVGGTTTASGLTVTGAEVTIRDDDDRGVTVSETELEIDEGGTGSYTVKLTSQPTGEVTVALGGASGDVSADTDPNRTGNQNTLTFTSGNWETAQTVTVTAAEDDDAVADDAVTLTHALSGGDYADVSADPVIVTVKENETPAAVLTLAFAEPDHDDRDNSGDVTLGDVLTYTATATNSGNVPLADVAVSDLLVNAGGVECAALGLGGECELTGDYTVTQADVDAGEVANTATAAATGVSARTASRTTIVAQQKALTLAKTATTVSFGSVGDRIAYSYEVTNSGTVTLSGTVAITDDKIASGITCPAVPAAGLGPGASLTCTGSYTAAQADVDASQVTNKATAMLDGVESNEATATVTRPQLAGEVPTVSVEAVSDTENAGHLKFAVSLNQASAQTVTVDYATSNGTATAGEDYTPTEGTLTFPANSTASRTIAVPITDDAVDEADEETFTVTLRDPVNATLSALATTATGTIVDDDERGVTVSETELEIDEGGSGRYTVKLNSEPAGEVTVAAATATGSDADVQVSPARLRFTADNWDDAQTVTVSADEDADAADDAATIAHTGNGGDYRNVAGPTVDVTVADDETASTTVALSVEPQTVAEDAGTAGRSVTVTATLNQAPRALATEVTVAVAGGTATAGDDFTAVDAFAVTIAAGALRGSADFTLRPVDDDVAEAGETVTVSGTAPASSGLTVTSAAVTITDDDERGVTVSEETLPVTEGGSGTYTVVLTSQPTADVTVTVSVPPGTDVSATPTSLTFTSEDWDEEQTVTVRAADDDDAVADAPVTLTHAVSSTGDYGTNGVTADPVEVTIVEADTPTLSIADMRADEDAGGMVFTVTLSTAGSNEVTVQYATSNGTGPGAATAGEDYTQKTGSLTFAAGTTTAQEIRVPITDDDVDEADEETFALTLSEPSGAVLAGGANTLAATGTIADDDDPPAAGIADAGASEADGGITFTVSLETASARVVTVDWATAADAAAVNPATADADYTAANGTLAFPAQSTERTIRVLLVDDDAVEESETFKVELGNPRYAILGASAAAVGTITDDDAAPPPGDPPVPEDPPTPEEDPPTPVEDPPTPEEPSTAEKPPGTGTDSPPTTTREPEVIVFFGAADYEAAEGGSAAVTVRLSADPERRVTIPLKKTHLGGAGAADYSGVPANVAFAAGETSQEFAVTAVDDAVDDDGEAVLLGFGALPSRVAAGEPATAAVALADDDVRGVTVRPEALNVPEGGSGSYAVVLDTEPTAEVTVAVAAPSASELSLDETSLTFAPAAWNTPQTVTVRAAGDADAMADDPVTLTHAVTGGDYEGVPAAAVEVTIIEDDAPTLAVAGGTAAEGAGAIEFAVTLSLASSSAVTVEYATSDVSATAGADYQWTAGTLTLPPGTTEAAIRVPVVDDDIDEADETFRVLLSHAVNAVVGDGEAAGEIADDDLPVVEIAADRAAVEEGGAAAFTLTRAGDPSGPLSVPVRVGERGVFLSDGVPSAVTFAATAATAALEVATTDDEVDEADGAVTAAILGTASHRVGALARAVVTVADNDVRGVRVSTTALTLPEGEAGTYTVALETEPTGEVTIRMRMVSEDLTVTPPVLSFSPMTWDAPQTVTVSAAEDADAVLDPAVTLTHAVSGGDYGDVPASPVEVRILEDDAPVLAVAGGAAAEGDGEIEFGVILSVASSSEVTVEYATAEGTARAGEDFEPAAGTLTFPAGATAAQTIRVRLVDDDVDEAAETFTVRLSHAVNAAVGDGEAAGEIADDDLPVVEIAADQEAAEEEGGTVTFTLTRAGDLTGPLTVPVGVTQEGEYLSGTAPSSVRFAAGAATAAFAVATENDDRDEEDGAVAAEILGDASHRAGASARAAVPVADDDVRGVRLSATSLTVAEGGRAVYTVVLTSEPDAAVTVAMAVPSGTDLTVVPSELTFAAATWEAPRTVTVRADQDADAVSDDPAAISHVVGGGDYEGLSAPGVEVTITEDDAPVLAVAGGAAAEGDGEIEFAVTLSLASSSEVTVEYATAEGTARAGEDFEPATGTLTFPAGATAATIRVRLVDDDVDEAAETFTVRLSHAVNAAVGDGEAAGEIADDDLPVVEIAAQPAALKEGGTATFTLTRAGDLAVPLSVPVRVGELGSFLSGTAPSPVAFAAGAATAAFAVATEDDAVDEADGAVTAEIIGGDGHRAGAAARAAVAVADDDVRGVQILETSMTITEGGSGFCPVVLTSEPTAPVTFSAILPAGADITMAPPALRFTPANWSQVQVVTVRAFHDADAVADDPVVLAHTVKGGDYEGLAAPVVTVTIAEDDVSGVKVSETALTLAEGGGGTYTVVLDTEPAAEVTVAVEVPSGTDLTVTPSELRFTATDWNTAQAVTVTASHDADAVADDPVTLAHEVSGGDYQGLAAAGVEVTITEDDVPGVTISETALTLAEGDAGTYTVALDTKPAAEVTVAVEVPEGAEITAAPPELTFTTETWNTEQTVTVTSIQDADAITDDPVTLVHTVSGGDYQGLAAAGVEVTITEDDVPGVKVSEPALTLAEGDAGTYTVVLDTEPAAEVTVAVGVPEGADLTVSPQSLRFAPADWNEAQTVTVTASHDADAITDDPVTLVHTVSGGDYEGLAAAAVEVTITEDDVPGVTISETALTLAEGDAGTYTVALDTEPAAGVTVAVAVPEGADLTVSPQALRFTAADWNTAQTVTVTASHDADAITDDPVTLVHTVSGGDYEGLAAAAVEVTITEDDVPGVQVSETALTLAEGGSGTYTVVLDTEPAAEVTVAVGVPEGADLTVSPQSLRFAPADWNEAQTVTVTASHDADAITDDPVTLVHTVSGGDYEGLAAAAVEVTITEDDLPVLTIADAEAPESAGQILFTVTLSLASSRTVTVDGRTADGTARAHEDYTAEANLLTFAPGRTEATIAVPVTNDGLREGNETFTVVLSNPAYATMAGGAATGTIVDDDASVDEAWLARFGRTAAGQVIEALDERLRRLPRGAHLTMGGQRLELGEAPGRGSRPSHRNIHPDYRAAAGRDDPAGYSWAANQPGRPQAPRSAGGPLRTGRAPAGLSSLDILARSSFFLSSGPAPGETGARWSFWRRWAKSHFRGEDTGLSLDGGPWTGLLGVDREQGRTLAGLALSYTIGDGRYHVHTAEEALARGKAESWLINAHPYLRVALNERVSAWGLVGHGRGQMSLGAGRERSGIAMTLGGLGLRGALLPPGRLGLTLRSDAFLVRMRSAAAEPAVSRVRMAMEGTRAVVADSGRTWTPSLELGVRHDGGDAETGLGMEMGGGLGYRDPGRGLTVKTTVRRLLLHQDSAYEEWGVGGSFDFGLGASGRGLALRLRSSYGDAASGVGRFWSPRRLPRAGGDPGGRGGLFNAEVGYGLGALGGLLTPYADIGASGRGTRTYGLGGRLRVEPSLRLELAGGRRETTAAPPGHELRLRGTLHW